MHPWRERLSRWLTPVARRTSLSPNTITGIALLLNLLACAAFLGGGRRPAVFLLGMLFIAVAGFADALDGLVARVQKKETAFGDFLDHVCDRISDTLLAACWMIGNGVRELLVVAALVAIMLNGYLGTQIEATFHQRNYESFGRGEYVLGLVVLPIASYILFQNGWQRVRWAGLAIAEWLAVVLIAFALLAIVQRLVMARRMSRS